MQPTSSLDTLFRNPPSAYRGKTFWAWNGQLERNELLRQIRIIREMGMGGAFMHSRTGLKTRYLSDEWLGLINACADEFEALGLEGWLYDEDRWPSGSAGGLATANPEFRMQYLRLTMRSASEVREPATDPFSQPDGEPVAVFAAQVDGLTLGDYRPIPLSSRPALSSGESLLLFTRETMPGHSFYNGNAYLDTMNIDATRHFIEVTHERYRAACADRLGRSIPGIFTDEPHRGFVMCDTHAQPGPADPGWATPWTGSLPAVFESRWGYDLRTRLPELFLRKDGQSLSPVKWHYMETIQTLFLENWARPLHEWCREHKLRLTGHALHENSLVAQAVPCGSMMRYYEHMDVPGVDVLARDNRNYWIVKQLASVARQQGRPWLLSELYGCTGWETDFAKHKEIGDWQALLGINVRCHHLSWYTMAGESKRDYPASIFFQSSWYPEYKYVEDYYARLHVLLQRGEPVCDLLVVHPVESLWAQVHVNWATWLAAKSPDLLPLEETFRHTYHWLAATGVDFDYGDEDHLARFATIETMNGRPRLRVGDSRYQTVLVSGCVTLRSATLTLLEAFEAAGGVVIFSGDAPTHVDALPSSTPRELASRACVIPFARDAFRTAIRTHVPMPLRIIEPEANASLPPLIVQLRRDGEAWIVALHHPGPDGSRQNCRLRLHPGAGAPEGRIQVQEWDARTGGRYAHPSYIDNDGNICWMTGFAPLGERLFVVTSTPDPTLTTRPALKASEMKTLSGPFHYELDEPNALVLDFPEWQFHLAGEKETDWHDATEILKIDESLRERFGLPRRSGMMVQPWAQPASAADRHSPLGIIKLRYTIRVEGTLPEEGEVHLAIEAPEEWQATLNGRGIDLNDAVHRAWFVDPALRRVPLLPNCLHIGTNTLELSAAFHAGLDLEACYLLGNFGVWLKGATPVMNRLPAVLDVGDVVAQGLPFYSGRIRYHLPIFAHATRLNGGLARRRIRLARFGGAVAVLRWSSNGDGGNKEILAFPPYVAELDQQCSADTEAICEVVLTRRNLLGPLHLLPKESRAIGPESFRSRGIAFSDCYQLFPSGLLEPPLLEIIQ